MLYKLLIEGREFQYFPPGKYRVYHGTAKKFDTFRVNRDGEIWFTTDKNEAMFDDAKYLITAEITIKKPIIGTYGEEKPRQLAKLGIDSYVLLHAQLGPSGEYIRRGRVEDASFDCVVFSPSQVRIISRERIENGKIQESLERAVPWKWQFNDDDASWANFTVGGLYYTVTFDVTNWEKRKPILWELQFRISLADLQARYDTDKSGYDILNSGHAFEVFATVIEIIRDFIKRRKPVAIEFSAHEASRQKLYARFAKMVSRSIPGYVGKDIGPGSFGHEFQIQRVSK